MRHLIVSVVVSLSLFFSVGQAFAQPVPIVPPPAASLEACTATLDAMRMANELMSQDMRAGHDQDVLRRAILMNQVRDLQGKVKQLEDKLDAAKTEVKPKP